MSIYIETKGIAGSDIKNNTSHCIELAIKLGIGVELSFNGYNRIVWNSSCLDDILNDYNDWCIEQSKNYKTIST